MAIDGGCIRRTNCVVLRNNLSSCANESLAIDSGGNVRTNCVVSRNNSNAAECFPENVC